METYLFPRYNVILTIFNNMLNTSFLLCIFGTYSLSSKWREGFRPFLHVAQVTEVEVAVDAVFIVKPHEASVAEILEPSTPASPGVVLIFRYPLIYFFFLLLFFNVSSQLFIVFVQDHSSLQSESFQGSLVWGFW